MLYCPFKYDFGPKRRENKVDFFEQPPEMTHLLQNVCVEALFSSSGYLKNQNP